MRVRYVPETQSDRSALRGGAIGIISPEVGSNVVVSGIVEGTVNGWDEYQFCDTVVAFIDAPNGMLISIMDEKRFFEAIDTPKDKAANVASIPLDARIEGQSPHVV